MIFCTRKITKHNFNAHEKVFIRSQQNYRMSSLNGGEKYQIVNTMINLDHNSILFGFNTEHPHLLLNLCILLIKKIIFNYKYVQKNLRFTSF